MKPPLLSYGEAARKYGVRYETISDIVRSRGLNPKALPHNGNGKGLDPSDLTVIEDALGIAETAAS